MKLSILANVAVITFAMFAPIAMQAQASATATDAGKAVELAATGGGLATATAYIAKFLSEGSAPVVVSTAYQAPEISTSGSIGGLVLLLGGAFIIRGRERLQS